MKVRFVYFTILLFAMCLMASCTHPEISSPNINQTNEITEANETNESNQSIDPNAPLRLDNLNGMFTGFRDDFGGSECGGMCWDIYTFLPDNRIVLGAPANGGPEMIDCEIDDCQSYSVTNGQLELSGGDSFPIELEDEDLRINNIKLAKVDPVPKDIVFDNHYKNISYSGLIGITGGASSKTRFLVLNPDGTFELSGVTLGSIGATSGGTSTSASSSDDIDAGTYKVENNTITLTGNDGSMRNLLFFIHDNDVNDIQLGEKNYYVDDDDW